MLESKPGIIPDRLRPIAEARTAHESLRAALKVVQGSSPTDQKGLLENETFRNLMQSAFAGLDEKPEKHKDEVLGAFSKEVRELAEDLLY